MTTDNKLILLGVISAAHGIRGDVLIKPYTEKPENLATLPVTDSNGNALVIKIIRNNKKNELICRIQNCTDRNHAEALKGTKLYCQREDLPEIEEEEFYIEDLRGLNVLDESEKIIGTISDVVNYGAGDIIEIKFEDGSSEMFPFTKELFPHIKKDYVVFARSNFLIK
jgi:16S rRNA processing protein RimM